MYKEHYLQLLHVGLFRKNRIFQKPLPRCACSKHSFSEYKYIKLKLVYPTQLKQSHFPNHSIQLHEQSYTVVLTVMQFM